MHKNASVKYQNRLTLPPSLIPISLKYFKP